MEITCTLSICHDMAPGNAILVIQIFGLNQCEKNAHCIKFSLKKEIFGNKLCL